MISSYAEVSAKKGEGEDKKKGNANLAELVAEISKGLKVIFERSWS